VTLLAGFYELETLSLTLREDHKRKVFLEQVVENI
jgi:hypothetical protein